MTTAPAEANAAIRTVLRRLVLRRSLNPVFGEATVVEGRGGVCASGPDHFWPGSAGEGASGDPRRVGRRGDRPPSWKQPPAPSPLRVAGKRPARRGCWVSSALRAWRHGRGEGRLARRLCVPELGRGRDGQLALERRALGVSRGREVDRDRLSGAPVASSSRNAWAVGRTATGALALHSKPHFAGSSRLHVVGPRARAACVRTGGVELRLR